MAGAKGDLCSLPKDPSSIFKHRDQRLAISSSLARNLVAGVLSVALLASPYTLTGISSFEQILKSSQWAFIPLGNGFE